MNGFVVYSFDKNKSYLFVEDEESENARFHFCREAPDELSYTEYLDRAKEFKNEMLKRDLSKAIFSRVKYVHKSVDAQQMFEVLCETYPNAFVYLISSSHFGTWIGASPEPLIQADDNKGCTVALAGTMRTDEKSDWTEKDKNEQYFVQTYIHDRLKSINIDPIFIDGPKEYVAGPVKHLQSVFNFGLNGNKPLEVAKRLHPTPAVSGLPQRSSVKLIYETENYKRSLYTGFLGEVSESDANLFVNLRCAQIFEDKVALYLGGGFTKDSDIEKEWMETENKSKTLLKVIENM